MKYASQILDNGPYRGGNKGEVRGELHAYNDNGPYKGRGNEGEIRGEIRRKIKGK